MTGGTPDNSVFLQYPSIAFDRLSPTVSSLISERVVLPQFFTSGGKSRGELVTAIGENYLSPQVLDRIKHEMFNSGLKFSRFAFRPTLRQLGAQETTNWNDKEDLRFQHGLQPFSPEDALNDVFWNWRRWPAGVWYRYHMELINGRYCSFFVHLGARRGARPVVYGGSPYPDAPLDPETQVVFRLPLVGEQ